MKDRRAFKKKRKKKAAISNMFFVKGKWAMSIFIFPDFWTTAEQYILLMKE